ncbi:MAG: hypothetical protein LBK99_17165 [Opitutaceae bacterium]|jgi:hypothetical protein|nr:hypothetical protein [Opitutaceae bacterium]
MNSTPKQNSIVRLVAISALAALVSSVPLSAGIIFNDTFAEVSDADNYLRWQTGTGTEGDLDLTFSTTEDNALLMHPASTANSGVIGNSQRIGIRMFAPVTLDAGETLLLTINFKLSGTTNTPNRFGLYNIDGTVTDGSLQGKTGIRKTGYHSLVYHNSGTSNGQLREEDVTSPNSYILSSGTGVTQQKSVNLTNASIFRLSIKNNGDGTATIVSTLTQDGVTSYNMTYEDTGSPYLTFNALTLLAMSDTVLDSIKLEKLAAAVPEPAAWTAFAGLAALALAACITLRRR